MSEESKKAILSSYGKVDSKVAFNDAYKIAYEYAKSGGAEADKIPQLIEELTHLFVTGELLRR
ncbi:hypothetical protein [Maridesulfovibrio sp.]|uniref:hypothetical protein n=1 Tax=unclassified Maridesulfovibrio TaxID=2794999 RepID=UPI003AFF6B83